MSCTYRGLGSVQKPYQYIGHEDNAYRKDFASARVRLCLAFPDAYEIGMSNTGMQILYHVVNEQEGMLADRVYAPLSDMGEHLRATAQRLQGRESGRSVDEFDILGFTLQYELCYTNVLYMLTLGGIPRRARDRDDSHPLVMGGGPCAFNPEPVADFFDFFVIGEGEEVIVEVLATLAGAKVRGLGRRETLRELQTVRGVYVPAHYTPEYVGGRFSKLKRGPDAPRWVERRIVKDLNAVPYPTKPVTPAILPIHERVSVEIQRGCTRSCRFCQAGYVYRPRRERDPERVLDIVEKSVAATGITDIGLLSLSSADYSHLHPVMSQVMARFRDRHLSISLPSTRLEALREEYLDVLQEERRSGFTIAPEAGSQRLRNVINKNFTEEEVVETARMLFRNGWQSVKMYFMIGQPTETDADVIAIAELANTVIRRSTDLPGRKAVTVSVSNFVPKPHTPFQWHGQITHAEILRKQALIKAHIEYRDRIQFRCHAADNSLAEGLLARGDRRTAALIERAHDLGAVFDCWQDRFDLALWLKAAEQLRVETGHDYLTDGLRSRDLDERLPWHRIHSGIHPKFFKNEWHKAVYGLATEDCSFAACHECGLCNEHTGVAPLIYKEPRTVGGSRTLGSVTAAVTDPNPTSFRLQFQKVGAGVFLGALDLQVLFVRAFLRAGLKTVYDHGIRPRPQISMGPALPLGVTSTCELMDIVLETALDAPAVVERVNQFLPDHLRVLTAAALPKAAPGISKVINRVSYRVAAAELIAALPADAVLEDRLANLRAAKTAPVARERKSRDGETRASVVDVKATLAALHWNSESVAFTLDAPGGQPISPHLVIDALLGSVATAPGSRIAIHKTGFS